MRRAAKVDKNQAEIRRCSLEGCDEKHKGLGYCYRHYCQFKRHGRIVYLEKQELDNRGDKNPNYKGAGWHICKECGDDFFSYVKTRKYCSQKCYQKTKPPPSSHPCKNCGVATPRHRKYCGNDCFLATRKPKPLPKKPNVKPRLQVECRECGEVFNASPSSNRKYCSYRCFLNSGGARRAGDASVIAVKKYGAKKDANHKEIFSVLKKLIPIHDLSVAGFGVPDGIGWVDGGWHLFDVKNPNTGYGRRGLNKRQKEWADDWRGGPVYLLYNQEDAVNFAQGNFGELKRFPECVAA